MLDPSDQSRKRIRHKKGPSAKPGPEGQSGRSMIDQLKQFSDLSVVLTTFVSNRAPGGAYLAPFTLPRVNGCGLLSAPLSQCPPSGQVSTGPHGLEVRWALCPGR